MRIASALLAALFVVAAALQLNDPDPVGWTAIYLAAAAASGLAAARRAAWPLAAVVGLWATVWAASFGGRVITSGMWRDVARAMGPEPGNGAEEARELAGLAIVAGWMLLLVVVGLRRRARS